MPAAMQPPVLLPLFLSAECPSIDIISFPLSSNKERCQVRYEAADSNGGLLVRYLWGEADCERQAHHSVAVAIAPANRAAPPSNAACRFYIGIGADKGFGSFAIVIAGRIVGVDHLVIPFDETTSTYLKGVLLAVREPAFLFRAVFQVRALDVPAVFLLDVAEQNRL